MTDEHIVNTERRSGEDRRTEPVRDSPDTSGNAKWIMGLIAALLTGVAGGWLGQVNKTIPDLQISMAVVQLRVQNLEATTAKLVTVIEQLRNDHEEDRRRAR